ncbi:MAG: COG3904 family protein [Saccharospirillum sp.]
MLKLTALITTLLTLGWATASSALAQSAAEPPFSIWISEDGYYLRFEGRIDYGATEHLGQVLAETPSLRHLRLNSNGGYVAEARGMVRLVEEHRLTTSAYGVCASSCTLAFIAGHERVLEPDARLGFHRYHQSSHAMAMFINTEQEQEKDLAIYRKQGVAEGFLTRMLETPPQAMWYPTEAELLEAGVLTDRFDAFLNRQP